MPYMRRSLNITSYYLNKWTGDKVPVFASSYLLNIVFPSKSRSVPLRLRKALRDFFCYYNDYVSQVGLDNDFLDEARTLYLRYHNLVFLPFWNSIKVDLSYSWHDLALKLYDCLDVIKEYSGIVFDTDLVNSLERKRALFLSKLYRNAPLIDLSTKAYVIRKKFNRQLAVEQL